MAALARAQVAAARSGVPALVAEAADAQAVLERPAARLQGAADERVLRLDEVAAWLGSGALVVDACRHGLRRGNEILSLARRPSQALRRHRCHGAQLRAAAERRARRRAAALLSNGAAWSTSAWPWRWA